MPDPSPTPEFDLSWLWDTINAIVDTIVSWFTSLWDQTTSLITNTGQGVYTGLVAFGSFIWDAILKGTSTLGTWLSSAFRWIYDGLRWLANIFGEWFNRAVSWIGSALAWFSQQLYNFGHWVYNTLVFIWNWLVNTLTAIWKGIVDWFSGLASKLSSWMEGVRTGINEWFTGLMTGFRAKIRQSVSASVTIAGMWKSAERVLRPERLRDIGFGLFGIFASPVIGEMAGAVVDAVIPKTSTKTFELIPSVKAFEYTPPEIVVAKPLEPVKPDIGVPPRPPEVWVPFYEVDLAPQLAYDWTWSTKDGEASVSLSYETEVV